MLNKLIIMYFHLVDFLNLLFKGCLKQHSFDYYVVEYKTNLVFFSHCTKCGYTEALTEEAGMV